MGIFDRFKTPKWQHKDWEVRIEAMNELNNQEILTNIAINDENPRVRYEAARKVLADVNDEKKLLEICYNNTSSFRQVAVEKISDESALIDIAKNDEDRDVRVIAVEKISDESTLIDIVRNDSDNWIRLSAALKISDESVLIDIAKNADELMVRNVATQNIHDESTLIDIAKNDENGGVRAAAVKNIHDEPVLGYIAKTDENRSVRVAAVKNLEDISILMDVAKYEEHVLVRSEIIKKINGNFLPIKEEGLHCDVCNNLIEDNGYYVPNILFYNSSKYYT